MNILTIAFLISIMEGEFYSQSEDFDLSDIDIQSLSKSEIGIIFISQPTFYKITYNVPFKPFYFADASPVKAKLHCNDNVIIQINPSDKSYKGKIVNDEQGIFFGLKSKT